MPRTRGYALVAAVAFIIAVPALAEEIQLGGIRLGQNAMNLLAVWGQPDGIVIGEGSAQPTAAQAPGAAAGAPSMMRPGMGMGGPGMMGPGMMGPGMMGRPGMGGPGMMGAPGSGMGSSAMGGSRPGMMGPGGPGMMGAGSSGMMGGPGMMGGRPGGMSSTGAAGASAGPFPIWALPVWITLKAGEVEWIYQRGPVVLGYALDKNGYITCIAISGEKCGYARTALWQPHKFIKLGDSYEQVLRRYGFPDKMTTFNASGGAVGQNSVTVSFNSVNRTFTRDCVLRYENDDNIAFTLHDFKVVSINIWQQ